MRFARLTRANTACSVQIRAFDYVGQAAGYEPFKFEDVNTGMLIDTAGLKVSITKGKGFYCWGPKKDVRGLDWSRCKSMLACW